MSKKMIHPYSRTARLLALLLLLASLAGCGDGGSDDTSTGGDPPLPARSDPQFGQAGNLLGSDRGRSIDPEVDQVWVGFNRQEEWERYLGLAESLAKEGRVPYVGGRVIADSSKPLGFYFDPDTTSAGDVVAETFQTSLDQLKSDPDGAANAGHRWAVAFVPERVVDDRK